MKNVINIVLLATALIASTAQCGSSSRDVPLEELEANVARLKAELKQLAEEEREQNECIAMQRCDFEEQIRRQNEQRRLGQERLDTKIREQNQETARLSAYFATDIALSNLDRTHYTGGYHTVADYQKTLNEVNAIISDAPRGYLRHTRDARYFISGVTITTDKAGTQTRQDLGKMSLLMKAALYGNAPLINAFIIAGMDIGYRNEKGNSAISCALASWMPLENVDELLKHGAIPTWSEKLKILKLRAQKYVQDLREAATCGGTSIAGVDAESDDDEE